MPNGGVIFPNPNAPTGIPLSLKQIEVFLEKNNDSVVIVDEASSTITTESLFFSRNTSICFKLSGIPVGAFGLGKITPPLGIK